MTFSIVARCPDTGQMGVAAATAMVGVGKLLAHAASGVGAIATQATVNPYIGLEGLVLLRRGWSAERVGAMMAAMDPGLEKRQFALVDRNGEIAVHTGAQTVAWRGHLVGDAYSVQGNRLAGQHVVKAASQAYEKSYGRPLEERFISVLAAGIEAGGDLEGERSATIYVMDQEDYPIWDLRVDDHENPLSELIRLHAVFKEQLLPQIRSMPKRSRPAGDDDEAVA